MDPHVKGKGNVTKHNAWLNPTVTQCPACTERFPLVGSGDEHNARPHAPDGTSLAPRIGNGIHAPSRGTYGIATAIRRARLTCQRLVASAPRPRATVVAAQARFKVRERGGRICARGVPQHLQWNTAATFGSLQVPTTISNAGGQRLAEAHKNSNRVPHAHGQRARPRSSPPNAHRMLLDQQNPSLAAIEGTCAQAQLSELTAGAGGVNTCTSGHEQGPLRSCVQGTAPITALAVHRHQQQLVSGHIVHQQQIGTQSCSGGGPQHHRRRRGSARTGLGPCANAGCAHQACAEGAPRGMDQLPRQRYEEMQSRVAGRHDNYAGGGEGAGPPSVTSVQGCTSHSLDCQRGLQSFMPGYSRPSAALLQVALGRHDPVDLRSYAH